MHYYKKNIGDYAKKTGRLSILQHGAYTLLLDACYDREQFPTYEEAIEWTWALSEEEISAVEFVLARFFKLEDGRYVQNRVREEIEEYNGKSLKNKQIAIEREAKRKEKSTNRAPVVHETPPNQEPLTTNHKPITINQEPITTHTEAEEVQPVKPSLEAAVCVLLKSEGIGSANPQNPTLVKLLKDGADIGMFAEAARISKEKGKGFSYVLGIVKSQLSDAVHVATQARDSPQGKAETTYQRSMRERWEEATGQRRTDDSNVIDITPIQTARIA